MEIRIGTKSRKSQTFLLFEAFLLSSKNLNLVSSLLGKKIVDFVHTGESSLKRKRKMAMASNLRKSTSISIRTAKLELAVLQM